MDNYKCRTGNVFISATTSYTTYVYVLFNGVTKVCTECKGAINVFSTYTTHTQMHSQKTYNISKVIIYLKTWNLCCNVPINALFEVYAAHRGLEACTSKG